MALWRRNHLKQPFIVDLGGSKDNEELEEGDEVEIEEGTQLNFTTNENGTSDTKYEVADELPDLNADSDYFLDQISEQSTINSLWMFVLTVVTVLNLIMTYRNFRQGQD